MSRTKVKQNLIDASFGNILEQVFYRADGRTVSTSQGNITVPNITSGTDITSTTLVDAPGSNIAISLLQGQALSLMRSHVLAASTAPQITRHQLGLLM